MTESAIIDRGRFDIPALKRAAAGRWPEILTTLGGIPSDLLDGRHHPCPKCGGTDRFRLVDSEAGAIYCNQCLAKGNGDGIAALEWATGQDFRTTVFQLAEFLGIDSPDGNGKPSIVATYDYRAGVEATGEAGSPAGRRRVGTRHRQDAGRCDRCRQSLCPGRGSQALSVRR